MKGPFLTPRLLSRKIADRENYDRFLEKSKDPAQPTPFRRQIALHTVHLDGVTDIMAHGNVFLKFEQRGDLQ